MLVILHLIDNISLILWDHLKKDINKQETLEA